MSRYFLDASFAIAARLKRDQNHEEVAQLWPDVMKSGKVIVTTSFVVDEICAFLSSRGERQSAVELGEILITSPNVELIHVDRELFLAGWNHFVRHDDKSYSLTDCLSFVVMEQRGLRQALTFDRHFDQAGFECLPASTTP